MHIQSRLFLALVAGAGVLFAATDASAQTIAGQDFDGGELNLISGFDPGSDNLDNGGGNFFGVGSFANWPQGIPPGAPFSIADDSVVDVSGQGANDPFPSDTEGVYGQEADFDNNFFTIADTIDLAGPAPIQASWTFDISSGGASPLQLCIDMGQMSNSSFGGFDEDADGNIPFILFEYSIDGGSFQTAFSCDPFDGLGAGFAYRLMDSLAAADVEDVCQATGPNAVTKIDVETGGAAANTILDRTPSTGAAAGLLDTFVTDINGTGSQIEVRVTTLIPFECMVFDNIAIKIPEPTGGDVTPDSFNAFRGFFVSGDLNDVLASDDNDLCYNPGITIFPSEAPVTLDFQGTLPSDSPSSLDVTVESSANTSGLGLTFLLFNYNTNSFEEVGTAAQSINTDSIRTFAGNPADHVEAGTGTVELRYEVRQVGFVFLFPWQDCVDHVFWSF